MAKKFQFSYPYASYMDISLMRETHTKKQLLAEYKAMQKEANRRLERLGKYKWMKDSDAYQYNKDRFKGGVSRMTKADLAKQMRDAAIFLSSKSSTLTGQRKRRNALLYTFREHWGLTFLNRGNIVDFTRFLGAMREQYGAGSISDNMSEMEALFRSFKQKKLDMDKILENLTEFVEKERGSDAYVKYKREAEERYSSDDYDRR